MDSFDQTVIAIGQTAIGGSIVNNRPGPQGPPGPGQLVGDLEMILVDGRLVGLRSIRHPNIRVLGAAMSPEMAKSCFPLKGPPYEECLLNQCLDMRPRMLCFALTPDVLSLKHAHQ